MEETELKNEMNSSNCFSKAVRSGRRTYFFDVKENRNGKRYLTITESRQITDLEGNLKGYRKNKVFLHREDLERFLNALEESTEYLPLDDLVLPSIPLGSFSD